MDQKLAIEVSKIAIIFDYPEGENRLREYAYDFADACAFYMKNGYDEYIVNHSVDNFIVVQPHYHLGIRKNIVKYLDELYLEGVPPSVFRKHHISFMEESDIPLPTLEDIDSANLLYECGDANGYLFAQADARSLFPIVMLERFSECEDYKLASALHEWYCEKLNEIVCEFYLNNRSCLEPKDYTYYDYDRAFVGNGTVSVDFYGEMDISEANSLL